MLDNNDNTTSLLNNQIFNTPIDWLESNNFNKNNNNILTISSYNCQSLSTWDNQFNLLDHDDDDDIILLQEIKSNKNIINNIKNYFNNNNIKININNSINNSGGLTTILKTNIIYNNSNNIFNDKFNQFINGYLINCKNNMKIIILNIYIPPTKSNNELSLFKYL